MSQQPESHGDLLSDEDRYYLVENIEASPMGVRGDLQAQLVYTVDWNIIDFLVPVWTTAEVEDRVRVLAERHGLRISGRIDRATPIGASDPAGVKGKDIVAALAKLGASSASFISRGDKSGTHAAELRYWKVAGVDTPSAKVTGYKECGCGMGPALNMASSSDAYVLADRGSWLSFRNRANLAVLVPEPPLPNSAEHPWDTVVDFGVAARQLH